MANQEYFFIGYVGKTNATAADYSKVSTRDLTKMMKLQAKRLNERLASLERAGMTVGSYAYSEAKKWAYDSTKSGGAQSGFMRQQEQPRFETASYTYDSEGVRGRKRTRQEIIEQLIKMQKFESYKSSTVSGVKSALEARWENLKKMGAVTDDSKEDFMALMLADSYELIKRYYGSETASYIVSHYSDKAVSTFIEKHPELFSDSSSIKGEGWELESRFEEWHSKNWDDASDTMQDTESLLDDDNY